MFHTGRIDIGNGRFGSVTQSCLTLCNPKNCSMPGQASLSITNSRSLLKLTSIKSVMPSNHLILCHALLLLPSVFASIRVFSSELALHIRWQSTGASASASVPPMNIPICRMGPTLGPGSPGYTLPRMPRGRTAKHGARGST